MTKLYTKPIINNMFLFCSFIENIVDILNLVHARYCDDILKLITIE